MKLRIITLFDGAGLTRLGLEQAGHECIGVELNPIAHYLSTFVGSGNCILEDARIFMQDPLKYISKFGWDGYDAIWASPPCQKHSFAYQKGEVRSKYAEDLLEWSLQLKSDILWVENVVPKTKYQNWGKLYNAAQFEEVPRQNRTRVIGGRYKEPKVYREYKQYYRNMKICPAITATEYKGYSKDKRRAARFYGRRLTVEECAYHMGFEIPPEWRTPLEGFLPYKWREELYKAIGNGVPVYMARAFGEAYKEV